MLQKLNMMRFSQVVVRILDMLRGDVLLVSRNGFLREGLAHALSQDTLSVAGKMSSPGAALCFLQSGHRHIDLIVFDADTCDDTDAMKAITDQYRDVSIVITTSDSSQIAYEKAAAIKAKAMLPNTVSAEALNLTLQLVILGENLFLATGDASDVMKPVTRPLKQNESLSHLSPREAEILSFIRRGLPNKIIARELDVAEATVKVHVKSVLRKIDVRNRTQAAIWAITHEDQASAA